MSATTDAPVFGQRIAGVSVPPDDPGAMIERRSPADSSRVVARFGIATPEHVGEAVGAARRAQPGWAARHPAERAEVLHRAARLLNRRSAELVDWEVAESGMLRSLAELHAGWCVEVMDFYAGLARNLSGRSVPLGSSKLGLVVPDPYELVVALGPWNFPLSELVWKLAPALAAGCAVISKPSELTPVTSLILDEVLAEAGIPAGLTSVLVGGREVGAALVEHPDVGLVSLTGGRATGQAVLASTARNLTPTVMELGGKSPVVVLPGADPVQAASIIGGAIGFRTGQQCICPSRVMIVGNDKRRRQIADAIHGQLSSLSPGDPASPDTTLGPVISTEHADALRHVIGEASARKMTMFGGDTLDGAFVRPAVLLPDDESDPVVSEELFGPYTAVQAFADVDSAIESANRSRYGLAAGVISGGDTGLAIDVARRLRAGSVWIDDYGTIELELPFGGVGDSGFGRELGMEGLESFVRWKSIHLQHGSAS
ncbi:MAG: aldehyde dehydrogenase family protein [Gammaproteobacteria bacterium]|nr:aldehyde dehydrogenase family protein [Gammaproteobacteria bacterium]